MSKALESILHYALVFSEGIDHCRGATTFNAVENGDNWTYKVNSDGYCRRGQRELKDGW